MSAVLQALRLRGRGPRQVPWLLALPGLVALVAFHFVAIGFGAFYAFTDWDGSPHATWIGLQNFREIFGDEGARGALWHTLVLAGCFTLGVNAIGFTLALGLHRAVKTRNLLRTLLFAPVALSPLAVALLWQWVFDTYGALNRALSGLGLGSWQHSWTADPSTALWTILVVMIWQFSGLAMVLYLAGLQGIPDEIYEATLMDGASTWFRLRKIVLPLLAPAVTVSATLTLITGLRVFDQVIALTQGGPAEATETLATEVYYQTIVAGRYGYGAAFALALTVLVIAMALTQLVVLRRNEGSV